MSRVCDENFRKLSLIATFLVSGLVSLYQLSGCWRIRTQPFFPTNSDFLKTGSTSDCTVYSMSYR